MPLVVVAGVLAAARVSAGSTLVAAEVTVVDVAGHPVPHAAVWLLARQPVVVLPAEDQPSLTTDASGVAHIEAGDRSEDVLVAVVAPGFALGIWPANRLSDRLVLQPGRDVALRLANARVGSAAWAEWSAGTFRVTRRADQVGRLLARGLPLSSATVVVGDERGRASHPLPEHVTAWTVALPAGANVTGRVVSEDGRPVVGATVMSVHERLTTTKSGEGGVFTLAGLPMGPHRVEISAEGFRSEALTLQLHRHAGLRLPDVVLRPGVPVTLRLIDGVTGLPVDRPRLVRESLEAAGFSARDLVAPEPDVVGDADGRITMLGLRLGLHRFVVDVPGRVRLRLPDIEITEFTPAVDLGDLVVGLGTTAVFTVRDQRGNAVPGLTVHLDHGPGVSPLRPRRAVTSADGTVSLPHLGPGRYRTRFGGDERPGGAVPVAQQWIEVRSTDDVVAVTVTIGGAGLTLRLLTGAGTPIAGARVRVSVGEDDVDETTRGVVLQTPDRIINTPFRRAAVGTTDLDGLASLEQVPVGTVRIFVGLGSEVSWSVPSIVAAEGGEQTLVVPDLTRSLSVADEVSGAPIAHARVRWTTAGGLRIEAYAGADGTATVVGVAPGPGRVEAAAPGFAARTFTVSAPDEAPDVLALRPTSSITVGVSVRSDRGAPVPDATAALLAVADPSAQHFAQTGADGRAAFTVPPTPHRLLVWRAGWAPAIVERIPVARDGHELEVVLQPGHEVRVEVGRLPEPAATLRLVLRTAHGTLVPLSALDDDSTTLLAAESEGRVGPLAAGAYTLTFVGKTTIYERRLSIEDRPVSVQIP